MVSKHRLAGRWARTPRSTHSGSDQSRGTQITQHGAVPSCLLGSSAAASASPSSDLLIETIDLLSSHGIARKFVQGKAVKCAYISSLVF